MKACLCRRIDCHECGPRMRTATQAMKARIKAAVERERPNTKATWRDGQLILRSVS